jgi:hypothetical protein
LTPGADLIIRDGRSGAANFNLIVRDTMMTIRVARWFVFKPKNPNLCKFGRALDWKMFIYITAIWNILVTFGIFYDHLVHFLFIWYIFPVLVSCAKKNLATLMTVIVC